MSLKKFLLIGICIALAACSQIQLGYNNAVPVLRWMLGDYVSIRDDQEADFNTRLYRFYLWHRHNELPEYASLARLASERLARGLKAEDVSLAYTLVRSRYRVLIEHAIDEAAPVTAQFDAAQIAQLEKNFTKSNKKFQDERLDDSSSEKLANRIERMQDNYEDWLGSLSNAQKQRIADAAGNMADLAPFQLAERQRNQQIFLGLLRSHASATEIAARLKPLLGDPDSARDPKYRAVMAANEKLTMELVLSLDQSSTPAQRQHITQRLDGYAADFAKLSKTVAQ